MQPDSPDSGVNVVTLDISIGKMDGGGQRLAAFRRALEGMGSDVRMVGVGPQGTAANDHAVNSAAHRAKRRLLPIPLRAPVERLLSTSGPSTGPTLSLIPSAHRWALDRGPTWIDFPDLWSVIARNHAHTVDPLSAPFNHAQSALWARRELSACRRARTVSVASWTDRRRLGTQASWLPTPVTDTFNGTRRSAASSADKTVYGMIANFGYPPNRDAYRRLVTEWLPVLAPECDRVVVAGFGSESLPPASHIDILGPVESVDEFYSTIDAVLVPIELGGGMKVKVVEAMMHGVPVIATEHSAEGLPPAMSGACIRWGSDRTALADPREDSTVANELRSFTFQSFEQEFQSLWRTRMAPFAMTDGGVS